MKKITIPVEYGYPTVTVMINHHQYVLKTGVEIDVEDCVAAMFEDNESNEFEPAPKPDSPGSSGGGASSWNDLKDKPFGETTVKGDTLTWDGNTDGLVSIVDTLFKVSDTVLNYDDFADGGFEVNGIHGVTSGNQSSLIVMQEFGSVMSVGHFYSFSESAVGVDVSGGEGMIPPESGTYFTATMRSLTIPGYNGFETTTIKPLDEKYLPESVKGGGATSWDDLGTAGYREDTVLYADNLEVDADTGGAPVRTPFNLVPGKAYDVNFRSDVSDYEIYKCIAESYCQEGIEMGVVIGNTSVVGGTIESEAPFVIMAASEAFQSQMGATGMIMPLDGGTYINRCIIDGPVAIVNPIPERYLPEKLQSFGTVFFYTGPEGEVSETGCYLYSSADTTKAENRVTKEELLAVIHSGRAICLCSTGSNGDLFYFANITFAQNRLGGCMSAIFRIGDLEIFCFTAEHP